MDVSEIEAFQRTDLFVFHPEECPPEEPDLAVSFQEQSRTSADYSTAEGSEISLFT